MIDKDDYELLDVFPKERMSISPPTHTIGYGLNDYAIGYNSSNIPDRELWVYFTPSGEIERNFSQ